MKWLLILILYGPHGNIEDVKFFPDFNSKDACEFRGKQAEEYYGQRGLNVKHKCATDI